MKFGLIVAALFGGLLFGASSAHAVELSGRFMQGGLVMGMARPGSRVTLDGTSVEVAPGGAFVFGFGRDAGPKAHLVVIGPDGETDVRDLDVAKQKYVVQEIKGLPARKVTPKPEDIAHIKADNAEIRAARKTMTPEPRFLSGFTWPVTGPISGVFGSQRVLNGIPKNPHSGVDVAAPEGTTIVAPAAGVVALVDDNMFYTGNTVIIDHGLGLTTVYAHMDSILVVKGQVVDQGTPIGTVGKTGRVTGAHLHWGMTWKTTHLDPMLVTGPMPSVSAAQ
jgi:murein DD-endopeptidase MepM/ murein hydrolase activator NlpD